MSVNLNIWYWTRDLLHARKRGEFLEHTQESLMRYVLAHTDGTNIESWGNFVTSRDVSNPQVFEALDAIRYGCGEENLRSGLKLFVKKIRSFIAKVKQVHSQSPGILNKADEVLEALAQL